MLDSAQAPLVYEAAGRWIEAALKTDDSLFTPGTPIWSKRVVGDLYERFIEHPDVGPRHFEEKFRDQISGAAPETIQLAGELLYVHFLLALDVSGQRKRSLIETVLNWSSRPASIPSDLATALDQGFVTMGAAFGMHRPDQLAFFLEFVRKWKTLEPADRQRLLADAWQFKEFAFALPVHRAQTQRAALLHLVHPDTFESITSEEMKRRIASAFNEYVTTESPDVDRQLEQIRAALTEEYGRPFGYWDPDVNARWSQDESRATRPPRTGPRPGGFSRQDTEMAQAAFEGAIPVEARERCAELLADLIELADATRSGCWTANLFPDSVVLIVGNAYVLRCRSSDVFVTLDTRELDEPTTSKLEGIASKAWEPSHWRSAPTFRSFEFGYPTLEEAQTLFETALRSAVRDLASRFSRSPFTEAYSQGLVDYLSEVTGRTLPSLDVQTPVVGRKAWIFQANPTIYAIDRALQELPAIEWTVRQHRADVHAGDRVYVWRSGSQAGVIAVGTVMNDPVESAPAEAERAYYLRPEEFAATELRVDVQLDQVLDATLRRSELAVDPVLSLMTVIRMQGRGTNFLVTPEQDATLQAMLMGGGAAEVGDERYFVLQQRADTAYDWDEEGVVYHFTAAASGSWKKLSESPGARFVYYRPGADGGATSRTFFGAGRIGDVEVEQRDGERHFLAHIDGYAPFARPVSRTEFDPRRNVQMSIAEISREQYEELVRRGGQLERVPFTVESITRLATEPPRNLLLGNEIYASVFAALTSGKHVILTGPPGTAKTTLAEAVAEAAAQGGLCAGHVLTTATADWTTYETIGGLKPVGSGQLEFSPGHFLEAIQRNQWLVIDELNRSNFDRAFGQLFTVLSGQAVRLPYTRPGRAEPLTLVPEGVSAPPGSDELVIPSSWRVVATMNVFDKSLLFEMSFALMRRFAFIEVPSPDLPTFEHLITSAADGDAQAVELTMRFLALRSHKDLGPALFMDMARYLAARGQTDGAEQAQLAFEAFYSFLLPQFEGVDQVTGERVFSTLRPLVGSERSERLRKTLNTVLGLEISAPAGTALDEEPAIEIDEPDLPEE